MRLDSTIARRRAVAVLAAALSSSPFLPSPLLPLQIARAEFGEGANIAPPALVPSPFRPTGQMAETCEVVALGREDVCLEYKQVLTAYDKLKLSAAREELDEPRANLDSKLVVILGTTSAMIKLIEKGAFVELEDVLNAFDVSALAFLAKGDDQLKRAQDIEKDVKAVITTVKSRDASPIARATIKLASDLNAFADNV